MKRFFIIIIIIVTGYILLKIWESDTFQSYFFPQKYWQKQVESAQAGIDGTINMIKDTYIELEKLDRTKDLEIAQAINEAKFIGDDIEEARKLKIEEIKEERELYIEDIKEWRKFLKEEKKNLEIAKGKLKEYSNSNSQKGW